MVRIAASSLRRVYMCAKRELGYDDPSTLRAKARYDSAMQEEKEAKPTSEKFRSATQQEQ